MLITLSKAEWAEMGAKGFFCTHCIKKTGFAPKVQNLLIPRLPAAGEGDGCCAKRGLIDLIYVHV